MGNFGTFLWGNLGYLMGNFGHFIWGNFGHFSGNFGHFYGKCRPFIWVILDIFIGEFWDILYGGILGIFL